MHRLRVHTLLFIFFACVITLVPGSFAQEGGIGPGEDFGTNPKDRENTVTATVPDIIAPSIPILVSPTNNSSVNTAKPPFVWQGSTDNVGVDHYVLYLDGSIYIDDIPITATDTSSYTLTVSGNEYTLTPKNNINNGTHTWKVQAVDAAENIRDSATWSFTIDTQAPTLVITQIGEESTSISSQDSSTLPDPYLEIDENEPTIAGTTEANTSIQLTLIIPSQSNQVYNFDSNGSGNWSVDFPILPREQVLTMNFIVTDDVGNVTVLNDVKFLIKQQFIFGTPTNTPTVTPTSTPPAPTLSPTPEPTLPPGVTATQTPIATLTSTPIPGIILTPTNPPSPFTPPGLPNAGLINITEIIRSIFPNIQPIPYTPPKEVLQNVINAVIPEAVTEAIPEVVKDIARELAPAGSALVVSTLPLTATVALASQFGWGLSLQILIRILQALGILPPPRPQGLVFNSQTEDPVPFAILNIQKIGTVTTQEVVVTNTDGVYGGISFSPGKYKISVQQQEFLFPTARPRPQYLSMYEYYKGENFEIKSNDKEQLFLIPLDPIRNTLDQSTSRFSWTLVRERLIRISSFFIFPLFFLSLFIYIFYPTVVNGLVTLAYICILALRVFKLLKIPRLTGQVVDEQGNPLANVFVRIMEAQSSQLVALLLTDHEGKFKAFLPKDLFHITFVKSEYLWVEKDKPQQLLTFDTRKQRQHIVAVMKKADEVYAQMFGDDIFEPTKSST